MTADGRRRTWHAAALERNGSWLDVAEFAFSRVFFIRPYGVILLAVPPYRSSACSGRRERCQLSLTFTPNLGPPCLFAHCAVDPSPLSTDPLTPHYGSVPSSFTRLSLHLGAGRVIVVAHGDVHSVGCHKASPL